VSATPWFKMLKIAGNQSVRHPRRRDFQKRQVSGIGENHVNLSGTDVLPSGLDEVKDRFDIGAFETELATMAHPSGRVYSPSLRSRTSW